MTSWDHPDAELERVPRAVASSRSSLEAAPAQPTLAGGSSGDGSGPPRVLSRAERTKRAKRYRRRRIMVVIGAVLLVFLAWLGYSLGSALTNPSLGSSMSARFAEWGRGHHLGSVVSWVEKEWYALNPPKTGGKPPKDAFAKTKAHAVSTMPASCPGALPAPTAVVSPVTPALPGEGAWAPIARLSAGCPALYEAFVRPDDVHTSYVAGIVWMDPKLLSFTLYSGSQVPGGGPYTHTAPITSSAAETLMSAFNAGFLPGDSQGGYYTDGKTIIPLVPGGASAVIYKDGTMNVGAWGSDVRMTPDVVSVRQNLDLIVDNGAEVPGLLANDNSKWGQTLGGSAFVWRSGLGITANGAIVYVGGPSLSITDLADLLVRAGAVRAMELDINTDWVQYSYYTPTVGEPASPANGQALISGMGDTSDGQARYFANWWVRDFFTTSARYKANGTMSSSITSSSSTSTTQKP